MRTRGQVEADWLSQFPIPGSDEFVRLPSPEELLTYAAKIELELLLDIRHLLILSNNYAEKSYELQRQTVQEVINDAPTVIKDARETFTEEQEEELRALDLRK